MVATNYKTVTYNVGGISDYENVLQRAGKAYNDTTSPGDRNRLITNYFTRCKAEGVDFICLQEVGRDLDAIKGWIGEDYEVVSDGEDAAVVWNKHKYSLSNQFVMNEPFGGGRGNYAVAILEEKTTEKVITVASTHLTGFNLEDKSLQAEQTEDGDKALSKLLQGLNTASGLVILGMDANTQRDKYVQRLDIAEKEGYTTDTSHEADKR